MNEISILIAEDHETVREGLKMIVNAQADMKVVAEARNGREAISLAREIQPRLVLMDISMPELSGLIATAKLHRVAPEIKVVILTRHTDEAYLQELLRAGISGYVLKQSSSAELLRAIREVAAGGKYLDPAITGKVFLGYTDRGKQRGETRGMALTAREENILSQIALGFSNKEIADKLEITVKTVETHKINAMQKLGISHRNDIVRYAVLQGWLRED